MSRWLDRFAIRSLAMLTLALCATSAAAEDEIRIAEGKQVSFNYTLSDPAGDLIESNPEGQPLVYTQGSGMILSALEAELVGLTVGDEKSVTLAPEDAYGPVDETAFQEVPIDQIPEEARSVGTLLSAQGFQGSIRVAEITEELITLDFNHPLAGKTLNFDITIIAVE